MALRKRKGAPQTNAKPAPTFDFEQDTDEGMMPHEDPAMTHPANIGPSVQINGELTSNEDVTVEGRVEGAITLSGGSLTVGPTGHIEGNIHARSVVIEGTVIGNVSAEERAEVTPSGTLEGDIAAARVVLSEGAAFRGNVDMGAKAAPAPKRPKAKPAAAPPPPALDFDNMGDSSKKDSSKKDAEPAATKDKDTSTGNDGSDDMLASLFDDEPAKT